MADDTGPLQKIRWLDCINVGASAIPPHGLVIVTGVTSDGVLQVARPTANGQDALINGLGSIAVSGYGVVTRDCPFYALYESSDGTPANGETWGAGASTYKLRKNETGFVVWGDTNDAATVMVMKTPFSSSGSSSPPFADDTPLVMDSGDNTKEVQIDAGGITTGTTRTWTAPDSNTTIPVFSQIITFAGPSAARTYTLPDSNQTLAGLDAAQNWTQPQTFLNASGIKILDTDASHTLGIVGGSDLSANRTLTITPGDANRAVTIAGDTVIPIAAQAITLSGPTAARTYTLPDSNQTLAGLGVAQTFSAAQTFPNTGLLIQDTNASHTLALKPGSDLTGNKTLTITTGDADRGITLTGDLIMSGAFNLTITITADTNVTFPASGDLLAAGGVPLVVPQWFKFTITKSGSNWRVTDQDGGTTDTALAAATTQTITLTSPAGGVRCQTVALVITTGLTGLTSPTMSVGYSGGDTSGGSPASSNSAYATSLPMGTTFTRARNFSPSDSLAPCPHMTSAWNVTLTFGASNNMTNLSGGQLDLWVLLSDVP